MAISAPSRTLGRSVDLMSSSRLILIAISLGWVSRSRIFASSSLASTNTPRMDVASLRLALSRHCEERSDEAIQKARRRKTGLLRCARNDGRWDDSYFDDTPASASTVCIRTLAPAAQ